MRKSKNDLRIEKLEKAIEHLAFIVAASQPCCVPFAYKYIKDILDEPLTKQSNE